MSSRCDFTYISTFAGCGGSSLGYKWAGGKGLAAVEFDANAVETYQLNFPETPVLHRDIVTVTADELLELTGLSVGDLDILDGSPPCQGFSTAGKRVLTDPRNSLFKEYVRLIDGLQPKVFVMENVSGMVKGKMKIVFREIMLALKATGYIVRCKLLNAMYYEVPQSRERLIWIGVRPDIGREPGFPGPVGKPKTVGEVLPWTRAGWYMVTASDERHAAKGARPVHCCLSSPAPTLTKTASRGNLVQLPGCKQPRAYLKPAEKYEYGAWSEGDCKAVASFPQNFEFAGKAKHAWARIGNSVPPRFMYHIASHIRDHILPAPEGA